jgi:hypothetical protein
VEVKEDKGFQQMMELQGIFTLNPFINIPPSSQLPSKAESTLPKNRSIVVRRLLQFYSRVFSIVSSQQHRLLSSMEARVPAVVWPAATCTTRRFTCRLSRMMTTSGSLKEGGGATAAKRARKYFTLRVRRRNKPCHLWSFQPWVLIAACISSKVKRWWRVSS